MDFNDLKVNFGVFHVLNPFMILSKQSEVVLTHFRWKIHITNSLAILMMRFDDISDSLPYGPLRAQCSALKNALHKRSPDIVDVHNKLQSGYTENVKPLEEENNLGELPSSSCSTLSS